MIGRELVYSRRYDANRVTVVRNRLYIHILLVKNDQWGPLMGLRECGWGYFRTKMRFEIELVMPSGQK